MTIRGDHPADDRGRTRDRRRGQGAEQPARPDDRPLRRPEQAEEADLPPSRPSASSCASECRGAAAGSAMRSSPGSRIDARRLSVQRRCGRVNAEPYARIGGQRKPPVGPGLPPRVPGPRSGRARRAGRRAPPVARSPRRLSVELLGGQRVLRVARASSRRRSARSPRAWPAARPAPPAPWARRGPRPPRRRARRRRSRPRACTASRRSASVWARRGRFSPSRVRLPASMPRASGLHGITPTPWSRHSGIISRSSSR